MTDGPRFVPRRDAGAFPSSFEMRRGRDAPQDEAKSRGFTGTRASLLRSSGVTDHPPEGLILRRPARAVSKDEAGRKTASEIA